MVASVQAIRHEAGMAERNIRGIVFFFLSFNETESRLVQAGLDSLYS